MEELYVDIRKFQQLYIGKWLEKKHKSDLVSVSELISDIEDLIDEVEHLEEVIEDMKMKEE